jgi:hypothetical protein
MAGTVHLPVRYDTVILKKIPIYILYSVGPAGIIWEISYIVLVNSHRMGKSVT